MRRVKFKFGEPEPIEKVMARLPESDREELRKMNELLARIRDQKAGRAVGPMPPEMRDWANGNDVK